MVKSKKKKHEDPFEALRLLGQEPASNTPIWEDVFTIHNEDSAEQPPVFQDNPKYDDRAAAIVFAAMLENALERAISSVLAPGSDVFSYDQDGPLSTFNSKIVMGKALKLYDDKMRKDLWRIKQIRNAFAHARAHVDFKHDAVSRACAQLQACNHMKSKQSFTSYKSKTVQVTIGTSRQMYSGSVMAMYNYLHIFAIKLTDAEDLKNMYTMMYDPESAFK